MNSSSEATNIFSSIGSIQLLQLQHNQPSLPSNVSGVSCSSAYGGGWWYGRCYDVNPTGKWGEGHGAPDGVLVGVWTHNGYRVMTEVTRISFKIRPSACDRD